MKKLNRKEFLDFILKLTKTTKVAENPFGKNSYIFSDEKEELYIVEFIPQSSRYLFTIYFRGIQQTVDCFHTEVVDYMKSLKLERNIIVNTENMNTLI